MICGCGLWVWLIVRPFSEVILYSRWRSGANVLSVVRSIVLEVVRISEVENTLYVYGDSGWCHRLCPLFRGCPLLGGSVNRGFTVYRISSYKCLPQINVGPVYTPGVQGAVQVINAGSSMWAWHEVNGYTLWVWR